MENNEYEEILGYQVPSGTSPCWQISDDDRMKSIVSKRPFDDHYPSCYFKITKRLDNNFLEGHLGHSSFKSDFHKSINSNFTYLRDYKERQSVYFSFDRISLYRLIEVYPTNPLTFILKRVDSPKPLVNNKAFMIMPFRYDELNRMYETSIKAFLKKELQIDIYRADDFSGNDIIVDTIYRQIEESEFVIADISHSNKNVFYELGWAAAIEKEIITIQNKDVEENIFFDRGHIRTRIYSLKNIAELQRQLKNDIIAIRDKVLAKN